MTNESKRTKNPIVAICAIVVAVILLVVVAILLFSGNKKLDDSFFVSDGSKYVYTTNTDDMLGLDFGEYTPEKIHLIYFYSGDKVTDLRVYYEFKDEEAAKSAAEYIKGANDGALKSLTTNGKYVIVSTDEALQEGMTAEDAKQQVEFMEMLRKINSGEVIEEETKKDEEETEEEVVEEEDSEEEVEEDEEEYYEE